MKLEYVRGYKMICKVVIRGGRKVEIIYNRNYIDSHYVQYSLDRLRVVHYKYTHTHPQIQTLEIDL